jgi:tetratricopeptide (TPR) repeat protein
MRKIPPVLAGPPSAGYRLRKFTRKHRTAVATAALFLLLLVVSVAVSTWMAIQATDAKHQAREVLAQATQEQMRARETLHDLANSKSNMGVILQSQASQPGAEPQLLADADKAFQNALAELETLAADFPGVPEYRTSLALTHQNYGFMLQRLGKETTAEKAYRRAMSLYEQLAADFPQVTQYRMDLVTCQIAYGHGFQTAEREDKAWEWFTHALAALRPLHEKDPENREVLELLRDVHRYRAEALERLQQYPEALAAWDRVIELSLAADKLHLQLRRALTMARSGKCAEAVQVAQGVTEDALYEAACVYAVASAHVPDKTRFQEQYAKEAVALLRRAQVNGYFKNADAVNNLHHDDDLNALRTRDDFKKLLAELPLPPAPVRGEAKK